MKTTPPALRRVAAAKKARRREARMKAARVEKNVSRGEPQEKQE
jgi:hypothetical protein